MKQAVMVVGVLALVGCAGVGVKKDAPTVQAGGYTWYITSESEGSIRIQANGIPNRQPASEAAGIICKKYGRVAQFVKSDPSLIGGFTAYDFNCVK
jgi:ABC-type phosphate transport system substrate-binding protein